MGHTVGNIDSNWFDCMLFSLPPLKNKQNSNAFKRGGLLRTIINWKSFYIVECQLCIAREFVRQLRAP